MILGGLNEANTQVYICSISFHLFVNALLDAVVARDPPLMYKGQRVYAWNDKLRRYTDCVIDAVVPPPPRDRHRRPVEKHSGARRDRAGHDGHDDDGSCT